MKKSILAIAITASLASSTVNAAIIDMDYNGLFVMLDPSGIALQNTSYPYYGDPTWGYGQRTQISGSMQLNTVTGLGTATINPFELFGGSPGFSASNFEFKSIGGSLLIGNMNSSWNSSNIDIQVVLDASGLFNALTGSLPTAGTIIDQSTCVNQALPCATPASNEIRSGNYPIGPVPIAATSFNTSGQKITGTTLADLSLGIDDAIGGSPEFSGPTSGFSPNFDFTSLTVTKVSAVPVPAAVWLFGTGLLSLLGVARRRKALSQC